MSSTVSVLWTRFNFLIVAVKGLNITMAKKKGWFLYQRIRDHRIHVIFTSGVFKILNELHLQDCVFYLKFRVGVTRVVDGFIIKASSVLLWSILSGLYCLKKAVKKLRIYFYNIFFSIFNRKCICCIDFILHLSLVTGVLHSQKLQEKQMY